ncbi:MAG TPA: formate--tetrahydrofolate ligase [Candidatus Ventricola gallistercoris]|nr:formate--tetrahydrofolate ligase [Candidatus Ventricola gallistercoris]
MLSDIEIAQSCTLKPIGEIAEKAGIAPDLLEPYGRYKAKVDYIALQDKPLRGKLVLVTAINPTPAGEGKTTVSIGLADALNLNGHNVCLALREPSLGPVFGVKGGAAGGGYAQVVPMEDINLHFTGDMHAITAANNLIAAMLDNSIQQGNPLHIDPRRVTWKRCMDMNDRQLRSIIGGLGGKANGTPREDGFDITTASEIMATLCLAASIADLKARVARIVVGRTYDDKPVTAGDLGAQGAVTALLKDALRPNLVQTLIGTPAFVHGGPFANIAHGCNTVIATKTALRLADVVVTEAGFGADLGAEKFIDIKCRMADLTPSAVVLVATVRALKSHGGVAKADLGTENLPALERGLDNLRRHLRNISQVWGLRPVVALNRFTSDTDAEIELVRRAAAEAGAKVALCEVWAKGGEGGRELARLVMEEAAQADASRFSFTYPDELGLQDKIRAVATRIYGAKDVSFAPAALKTIAQLEAEGCARMPVCIAKTQYSFSDDPKKLGAPEGFTLTIRSVRVSAGAGFVVALSGDIMTMPGLPKVPAAVNIDVTDDGRITGLF